MIQNKVENRTAHIYADGKLNGVNEEEGNKIMKDAQSQKLSGKCSLKPKWVISCTSGC